MYSLGGASVCLQCSYCCLFLDPMFYIIILCLLNCYYLILVSFHYNSLIIRNHVGIIVCTDDIPLLKVNFFYVTNYNDWVIFSCGACYRCISTDILPATWHCVGPGCPSACTTDCRSASHGVKIILKCPDLGMSDALDHTK